jgi:ATP-dependent DNA helicase RecG
MNEQNQKIIDLVTEALRSNSELHNIEFKDARGGIPGDLWKVITAFSNTPPGGIIVFGVKEITDGKRKCEVVGGLDLATLQEKIVSLIEHKIVNNAAYSLEKIKIQDQDLLILNLDETNKESKPCYNSDLGMHRGACIRIGNVNRLINEEELRSFLRYSPAYNYDKTPLMSFSLESLSREKIKEFLDKSAKRRQRQFPSDQPLEKLLQNLGLAVVIDNIPYPTLAGAIIFSEKQPQDYESLSRYVVRCVRYSGKSASSEIVDQQDIYGTLDEQVDDSMKFALRNIKTKARIVGTKREESFEFPELGLREVIVNALIHRDYSNTGTYVQIVIFQDRIEISNPGTLPPGVTVENLKISQFSRNGVIAKIMRDMDYMEEFGRGIDLIYSQMSKNGLVEPLFKNSSNSFKVTLLGDDYNKLNERQLKFWHVLQDKNHLTASIAHEYFPHLSRQTINADLKEMVDMGLIDQRGSSSSTYYEPKY